MNIISIGTTIIDVEDVLTFTLDQSIYEYGVISGVNEVLTVHTKQHTYVFYGAEAIKGAERLSFAMDGPQRDSWEKLAGQRFKENQELREKHDKTVRELEQSLEGHKMVIKLQEVVIREMKFKLEKIEQALKGE